MIAQDSTDIQQEILSRVDLVAQKFNEIAPEAWEILLRQQYIEAGANIVVALIFAIAWIKWGAPASRRWANEAEKGILRQEAGVLFGGGITLGVLAVATVIAVTMGFEGVKMLLNPEYYALMELKP